MTARVTSLSRLVLVNRALRAVEARLAGEFPAVPLAEVHETVEAARGCAARRLPSLAAFAATVEETARASLAAADAR